MALVKCPDCGKNMSEKASVCPKCGCPNGGNFALVEKGKFKKRLVLGAFCFGIILLLICVYAIVAQPSEKDSLFYKIQDISHDELIEKYGEPDDIFEMDSYFEYTYEKIRFMNIDGELVFRFDNEGSSGDLIFARWILDGAKHSEKKIEKICAFYDDIYGKRDVQDSGNYEWNNWIEDERIWLRKPEYSGGYYEFEYRPW